MLTYFAVFKNIHSCLNHSRLIRALPKNHIKKERITAFFLNCGVKGARTLDLLRDRQAL